MSERQPPVRDRAFVHARKAEDGKRRLHAFWLPCFWARLFARSRQFVQACMQEFRQERKPERTSDIKHEKA
jgi:hypothetical protein